MTECHVERKKGTRGAALQAQMCRGRAFEAPCQSSALLGIMQVLLEHVPPLRKCGMLLVGGFVESQHAFDGTELEEKLLTLLPSHSLKAYFRTSV